MSDCEFTWPLLDPNEEDRRFNRTHVCRQGPGHEGDHVCHCGERHPAKVCNYRWEAPRVEVPTSVPVNHVCARNLDHDGEHRCSCRATFVDDHWLDVWAYRSAVELVEEEPWP